MLIMRNEFICHMKNNATGTVVLLQFDNFEIRKIHMKLF